MIDRKISCRATFALGDRFKTGEYSTQLEQQKQQSICTPGDEAGTWFPGSCKDVSTGGTAIGVGSRSEAQKGYETASPTRSIAVKPRISHTVTDAMFQYGLLRTSPC